MNDTALDQEQEELRQKYRVTPTERIAQRLEEIAKEQAVRKMEVRSVR